MNEPEVATTPRELIQGQRARLRQVLAEALEESSPERRRTRLKQSCGEDSALLHVAERLLARPLRPEELKVCESVLEDLLKNYRNNKEDAEALLTVGESKCDSRVNKSELAAYTMAVNQLMNLDEVLTK